MIDRFPSAAFLVGADLTTIDVRHRSGIRPIAPEGEKASRLAGDIDIGQKPAEPIACLAP